jgi:hypothetical protein
VRLPTWPGMRSERITTARDARSQSTCGTTRGRYYKSRSRSQLTGTEIRGRLQLAASRHRPSRRSTPLWKIDGPIPHIPLMADIVQCTCGAENRVIEEKFLVPHTDLRSRSGRW